MLLLITGSLDPTADRIVSGYGGDVFRLNHDLWNDYGLKFRPNGWAITNPDGLSISSDSVSRAFWWKAFQYFSTDDDRLIAAEIRYIFKELYGWCALRGLTRGNFIDWHNRYGKINLLSIAQKYFFVPPTLVTIQKSGVSELESNDLVAKSLSSEVSNANTVLATTAVDPEFIDQNYPWYLQKKVISDWDVTVFLCGADIFSFRRSRKLLAGLDWRPEQTFDYSKQEWFPFELDQSILRKIKLMSTDVGIDFGRYDFMIDDSGEFIFLEINANGQWVFLDYFNQYGLLDSVVKWLKS